MENNKLTPCFSLQRIALIILVAFAIGFVVGLFALRKISPCVIVPTISVQRDTIRRTDTVHGKIVPPIIKTVIRRDTLVLPSKQDTTKHSTDTTKQDTQRSPQAYYLPGGGISIPIEQRTYATSQYRVVVSGWHPSLDSITLYPVNTTIKETITKLAQPPRKNWALVIGPSSGYNPITKSAIFGITATYGFVVTSSH